VDYLWRETICPLRFNLGHHEHPTAVSSLLLKKEHVHRTITELRVAYVKLRKRCECGVKLTRHDPYKLKGNLADGFLPTDLTFKRLIRKYEDKILVFIDKGKVTSKKLSERAKFLSDLKNKKISVEQLGLNLLCKKLGIKDSREVEGLLSALSEGDLNKAQELLMK